jgi:hypothetical protein
MWPFIITVLKHLTFVTLPDIVTTTVTISTSLVFYLYMDIWKIKRTNKWINKHSYKSMLFLLINNHQITRLHSKLILMFSYLISSYMQILNIWMELNDLFYEWGGKWYSFRMWRTHGTGICFHLTQCPPFVMFQNKLQQYTLQLWQFLSSLPSWLYSKSQTNYSDINILCTGLF